MFVRVFVVMLAVLVIVALLAASDFWIDGPSVEVSGRCEFHVLFLTGSKVRRFSGSKLCAVGKMDLDSHAG
jgi:hypothetical protein